MQPGAFDDYVKDVDAIEHTASPFHYDVTSPEQYISPAVSITQSVLTSALKHSTVQRVVITSSIGAVYNTKNLPRVLTEDDWHDESIEWVEREGDGTPKFVMYVASKTLAEKAAWEFTEKHPNIELSTGVHLLESTQFTFGQD